MTIYITTIFHLFTFYFKKLNYGASEGNIHYLDYRGVTYYIMNHMIASSILTEKISFKNKKKRSKTNKKQRKALKQQQQQQKPKQITNVYDVVSYLEKCK